MILWWKNAWSFLSIVGVQKGPPPQVTRLSFKRVIGSYVTCILLPVHQIRSQKWDMQLLGHLKTPIRSQGHKKPFCTPYSHALIQWIFVKVLSFVRAIPQWFFLLFSLAGPLQ